MNPGDAPRLPPGLPRQLADLARGLGEQMGLRVEPPLELEQTAAGPMLRLAAPPLLFMRLDAQSDPPPPPPDNQPAPNKWSWTEMLCREDGQVVERPGGLKGGKTHQYAVPAVPAGAGALGIGRPVGDHWEFFPVGADETFLVVLTDKDYSGPFIRYTAFRVRDADDPDPVTYTIDGDALASPVYHRQDIDLPVWRGDPGAPPADGARAPADAVHRARKGTGNWYFIGPPPRWDLTVRDPSLPQVAGGGVTYDQGYVLTWDQYAKTYVVKEPCLLLSSGNYTPAP